jgi:signal transduction histidine kinase
MSATSVSVVQPSRTARSPTRDPLSVHLLTLGVVAVLAVLLTRGSGSLIDTIQSRWPELLFWTALALVVNLFPIDVADRQLTLDVPILLAVAFLYGGEVGALVAVLGAVDLREIRRQITFSRSLFNRGQVGLSFLLAGLAFQMIAPGLASWSTALVAAAVALTIQYAVNVALVSLFGLLTPFQAAAAYNVPRVLSVGKRAQFLAAYLGHGVLALVIAYLYARVGGWSVVSFLIPTLVARQMLLRGQALEVMTEELRESQRLLERLVDRAVDERQDERLRIASDLHDEALQEVTRLWFLTKIVQRQGSANPSELEELAQSAETSIESLRDVIHDLRKSPLGRGGLIPTLKLLARDLQLDWKTPVRLESPTQLDLDAQRQVLAYQVIREALLNALKHARASEVRLTLSQTLDSVVLTVEDDGIGFDIGRVDQVSHFGLGLVRERIQRAGGDFHIQSERHRGTRLIATIPLEPRSD